MALSIFPHFAQRSTESIGKMLLIVLLLMSWNIQLSLFLSKVCTKICEDKDNKKTTIKAFYILGRKMKKYFSKICSKYFRAAVKILFYHLFCFCQVLCGTKPFSDKFKARRYKVQEQFLTKADFDFIMRNLPVKVKAVLNIVCWDTGHSSESQSRWQ